MRAPVTAVVSAAHQPHNKDADSHYGKPGSAQHAFRHAGDLRSHALCELRQAAVKKAFDDQDETDGGKKVAHSRDLPTFASSPVLLRGFGFRRIGPQSLPLWRDRINRTRQRRTTGCLLALPILSFSVTEEAEELRIGREQHGGT